MAECDKILDKKEQKRRTKNTRPISSGIPLKQPKRTAAQAAPNVLPPHDGLTSAHLLKLSKRITSGQELLDLGINVLKLPQHEVDAALYNNKTEIQDAAYKVLTTWLKKQRNRQEAYTTLYTALRECQMNFLATELKQWVEGTVGQSGISPERAQNIQRWLKESFGKPFNLINTQDWSDNPYKVDLRELFSQLSWKRKHRKAHGVQKSELEDITVLLSAEQLGTEGPVSILILGPGGIGKSTALKRLAVCWVDSDVGDLNRFDFVFHIDLKRVKDNSPIENIIISQHSGLEGNEVSPAEIKSILKGTENTILMLFDGHDEYKRGVNSDIDKTIEKKMLRNCWMILTSRDTEHMKDIKDCMDAEAEIHGFNEQNIRHYVTKSLGSKKKVKEFLEQAMKSGLVDKDEDYDVEILAIPLFLNMTCTLFKSNIKYQKTRSGIFQAIVNRIIERERKRHPGRITLNNVEELIFKLGKLAWDGLANSEQKNQVFTREEIIEKVGEEVFLLGLLIPAEEKPGQETDNYCFQHLLFQQFFAAKYVAVSDKDLLEELFPSQYEVIDHNDVLLFACGLTEQPDVLVEMICERYATFCSQLGFRFGFNNDDLANVSLLTFEDDAGEEIARKLSFCKKTLEIMSKELVHPTNINLLINKYINIVTKDQTTVYVPSRFYVFLDVSDIKYPDDYSALSDSDDATAECAIVANEETDLSKILEVINEIKKSRRILVTHLCLDSVSSTVDSPTDSEGSDSHSDSDSLERGHCRSDSDGPEGGDIDLVIDGDNGSNENVTFDSEQLNQKLTLESLEFSKHAKMILVRNAILSKSELSHIAKQLDSCEKLELLYLAGLSLSLSDKICTMKSLRGLTFSKCPIESDEYRHLTQKLYVCDKLEILDLSGTTGVPRELGDAVSKMTSLRYLNLNNCKMSLSASAAVLKALTNCPHLDELHLGSNTLTGCMVHLLGNGHPGFPQLDALDVSRAELTKDDLMNIGKAFSSDKLPVLTWLKLDGNCLPNCLRFLLNPDDHSTIFHLQDLYMRGLKLSKSDLTCLSKAATSGKLPKLICLSLPHNDLSSAGQELGEAISKMTSLWYLNLNFCEMSLSASVAVLKALTNCPHLETLHLYGNTLTGCMVHLLGDGRPRFPHLGTLSVGRAELTVDDFVCLSRALHSGKLPVLEDLHLGANCLTNRVSFLLNPDDRSIILHLDALHMAESELCKSDLTYLSQAVASGRLPNLKELTLSENNLGSMKEGVKTLILSCVARYKQQKLQIGLQANNMSEEFIEEIKSLCQGRNIEVEL